VFVEDLLERRRLSSIRGSMLITNKSGLRMSMAMMNNRWVEARERTASDVTCTFYAVCDCR